MKILQINKFYHIHGGTDRYFFEVSKLLKKHNHKVAFFSTEDKKNNKTKWSKFFVENFSFDKTNINNFFRLFPNYIFSLSAYNKINQLLDYFQPDLVHLHSIYHHLTPSILIALKNRNIPIVQTVEDYHLVSPNYNLFHDGGICEITKPNKFHKSAFHKCVKGSYLYSFAEVVEKYIYYILGWERNYVDYFIAPSLFTKYKLVEYDIDSNKIIYLPHFVEDTRYAIEYSKGNYILYFGRLSPEKGLEYLIETMKRLPKINLRIVGTGEEDYEAKLKKLSYNQKNIRYYGYKNNNELRRIISGSRFTILPSVWYEVFGLSILESFASRKPVIASNIGGIPETIKHGYNGFLFEPQNMDDLTNKINLLWSNLKLCKAMGSNAREYVERNFGPEKHYEKLMEIYRLAIKKHK